MELTAPDSAALLASTLREKRRVRRRAIFLIAPLMLFLLILFIVPIGTLLVRAMANPEVVAGLPQTVRALAQWDRQSPVPEAGFNALAHDLAAIRGDRKAGDLSRRLNYEIPGYRSLIFKTINRLPKEMSESQQFGSSDILKIDKRWADLKYWHAIARNSSAWTPYYLLTSLDLHVNDDGKIARVPPDQSAFVSIFARTFEISLITTLICLVLGYALAYWMVRMPDNMANVVFVIILIPFWTSVLVRISAWIVILQRQGLINTLLMKLSLTDEPIPLLFNRTGVYIAMIQVLLPYMILPIYSVMKSVSPNLERAAVSLGSHPLQAFIRIYLPQTYRGIASGSLLVFIIAVGYYITPALVGGASDQFISYYVAYFTDTTINWGMASALGLLLLASTFIIYTCYRYFSEEDAL
ncbi:ABC transporter permease [Castellaniella sp.]|uniref:ABC transporter permease n=1 Tax=Castellaniella sp. TaxID=1955812 RepID=UPI003563891D